MTPAIIVNTKDHLPHLSEASQKSDSPAVINTDAIELDTGVSVVKFVREFFVRLFTTHPEVIVLLLKETSGCWTFNKIDGGYTSRDANSLKKVDSFHRKSPGYVQNAMKLSMETRRMIGVFIASLNSEVTSKMGRDDAWSCCQEQTKMRSQYAREVFGLDSTMACKVLTEAFTINLHHLVGSHCDVKNESCPNQDNTMCAFAVIGVRDVGIQAKVELLRFGFGVDDSFCRSLIMYSRSDVRKFVQDTKSLQGNKSAELNKVLTAIRNAKNECWDYENFVEDRTRLASAIRKIQKSTRKN